MSFPLSNFESHLPSDILKKGMDYWSEGKVDNLAQDGITWTADVYGSDDYTVEVDIEEAEVTDWSCDCPYDWGDTCKHVAAVLFAIREEAPEKPVAKRHGRKPKSGFEEAETIGFIPVRSTSNSKKDQPSSDNPLRQIIDKLDAAELRSTLHYLAQRENEVKSYLLTKFSHLITTTSKGQYAALVKSIIDSHSGGRHGFIEYKEASRLGDRLYKLLDEAKEPMGSLPLVYLCEEVIRQLAAAHQDADDSSGSMGSAMEQAFYLLQKMAKDDKTPDGVVRHIFEYALKESAKKEYQGWDWAGNLRSVANNAVRTAADAERLIQVLDQSIKTNSTKEYRDYAIEAAELLKMDLMRKYRSENEADEYLYSRLHHSRFREKALENALQAGRYDEVRRLAMDGLTLDTKNGLAGLVTLWRQWLIRLAEATGDSSAQAASLEELYLDRGEMTYYRQLKKLLPKADFDKKVEQFIQHFRDRERGYWGSMFNGKVAEILVEENRRDDLMEELRKAPSLYLLDQYSARLSESFKAEYIALYEKCVRREMEQSSSRDGYQKCAVYVNKILQLGGLGQARQIVLDWRAQYPRRPAMLDELKRFKF